MNDAFPPIAEYGFLSDCEVNALIAPDRNVEWLCLPRPDSPSGFSAALDRSAGGFQLAPMAQPRTDDEAAAPLRSPVRFWRDWLSAARIPDHPWRPHLERSARSFWLVSALALIGETERAHSLYDKLLSLASPLLLYAAEIDVASGQHFGNFPQAFTHLALIDAVLRLIDGESGHEDSRQPTAGPIEGPPARPEPGVARP
ncbi:MAG: hypothetical protein JOZ07_07495 [Solirubrobacterales bacterium]|nr:hypothetical protein [Solirubrobacterales bacterium]